MGQYQPRLGPTPGPGVWGHICLIKGNRLYSMSNRDPLKRSLSGENNVFQKWTLVGCEAGLIFGERLCSLGQASGGNWTCCVLDGWRGWTGQILFCWILFRSSRTLRGCFQWLTWVFSYFVFTGPVIIVHTGLSSRTLLSCFMFKWRQWHPWGVRPQHSASHSRALWPWEAYLTFQ